MIRILLALLCPLALAACSSAYYSFWETLGYEKRDLFVSRVEDARDAQQDAKEEFRTTLERLRDLTGAEPGQLEERYRELKSAFDDAERRAEAVRDRIDSVRDVAGDLFSEWETEIDEMQNADLRARSSDLLQQTRDRYEALIAKMETSEERMEPVLTAFRDRVLALKAELNARAISQLEGTAVEIEQEVEALIAQMNESIAEAESFIESMGGSSGSSD